MDRRARNIIAEIHHSVIFHIAFLNPKFTNNFYS
jgi:hypothetical protein